MSFCGDPPIAALAVALALLFAVPASAQPISPDSPPAEFGLGLGLPHDLRTRKDIDTFLESLPSDNQQAIMEACGRFLAKPDLVKSSATLHFCKVATSADPGSESPAIKTYATLPSKAATQNICQSPDGTMYVTLVDGHRIEKVAIDGKVSVFADPPGSVHVLGVSCPSDNEIAAIVYDKTFRKLNGTGQGMRIADFSDTATHFMLFNATAKPIADITAPANVGLNGIAAVGGGVYLATDSNSGSIYRVDVATQKIDVWFKGDGYGPTNNVGTGANGIKLNNGWAYFSSTAKMGIYKLRIGPDGKPQGAPIKVESGIRPDDFDVAGNGDVYFPSGTTLYKVPSGGSPIRYVEPIPGGPSALVGSDQKWVYWPTRGGMINQRIVRVAIQ